VMNYFPVLRGDHLVGNVDDDEVEAARLRG
jgi:hypothetical protein